MSTLTKICKKRLFGDLKLLKKDPMEYIEALPDEENLLIWYFLVKGPEFSDFNNGYYIGKIIHNPEYPFKPPDFMMLTPNGRFMEERKICLSNSSYHSNEWSAMWNIKSILTGFLSIMLSDGDNGISHIHESKQKRQILAKQSIEYNKIRFPNIIKKFTRFIDTEGNPIKERDDKIINDKVIDKPVIDNQVIDKPVIDNQVIDKPVIDKPVIDNQVIDKPVIDNQVIKSSNKKNRPIKNTKKKGTKNKKQTTVNNFDFNKVEKLNTKKTDKLYKDLMSNLYLN
jgi:ubiquitin-conjugating enzyme E2 J2